jgi:hypothetical protein
MAVYFVYSHDRCDRCGRITSVRSQSFFTSDTVCMSCLVDEAQSMAELRTMGLDPATFEACGCVPTPASVQSGVCLTSATLMALRAGAPQDGPITADRLRRALRRLGVHRADNRTPPIEPETGRGLPPAL